MSDENPTTPQDNEVSNPSAETQNTEHMIPKSRFDEINEKYKALAQQIEQSNAEREKAKQKELAEQSRYKELYEETLSQLESLKSVQSEVSRYRESFESTLQSRLDQIPDEKKHLVPEFDDPIKLSAWLDKAMGDLVTPSKPNAPTLNGGSGGTGGTNNGTQKPLNPTQQALAEYAKQSGFQINSDRLRKFARNPAQQTDLDKQE